MPKDQVILVATAEQVEQAVKAARIDQHGRDVKWLEKVLMGGGYASEPFRFSTKDWQAFKDLEPE